MTAVSFSSYKAYDSYVAANMSEEELLMQGNVLALSETSSCPDAHYVPDHYIQASVTTGTSTSNVDGSLEVSTGSGKTTVNGEFKRGRTYTVIITTKNCDGQQKGSCCDQRQVGVSVSKK